MDKKYLFLSTSLFFKLIINIFVVFYIAKKVSINDFGGFSLAFIISTLTILVLDYGFNLKSLTLTSKSREQVDEELSVMIYAKLIIVLFVVCFFCFFFFLSPYNLITNKVIFILVLSAIPSSYGNFFLNNFKIVNRFDKEALGYLIQFSILVVFLFINEHYGSNSILIFSIGLLLARIGYFLYGFFSFKRSFGRNTSWDLKKSIKLIKSTAPYGIHLILGASIIYIDTFILSVLTNLESVGFYQAGMRIIMASMLIVVIINDAFIPEISKLVNQKLIIIKKLSSLFEFILLFSILMAITLYFYKGTIIKILFSEEYLVLESSILFIILITFLRYIGVVPGIILTSQGKQSIRAKAVVLSILVSIICNFVLIPFYGITGAFTASLIAHVVLNLIYIYYALGTIFFMRNIKYSMLLVLCGVCLVVQMTLLNDTLIFLIITGIINLIILLVYYFKRMSKESLI